MKPGKGDISYRLRFTYWSPPPPLYRTLHRGRHKVGFYQRAIVAYTELLASYHIHYNIRELQTLPLSLSTFFSAGTRNEANQIPSFCLKGF